jgi:Zn-dependent M28 family amino/carboxypeptidase|tara:strand:- start:5509 stop:7209 length:1701 start_codon:yes stop_codon:yes gene_type:complete
MQARATILALILIMLGCADDAETPAATGSTPATPGSTPATRDLSFANLEKHIEILASDEFEGRQPGSVGEEKTVAYIKEQFVKLGLKPGNGDSYFQTVPLGVLTADASVLMSIKRDGYSRDLKYSSEMMLWTKRVEAEVSVRESEMVFVGYGVVAPEYDWNDYQGLDVAGKTVLMLVNDPGYASQDKQLFTGNAMTYYGRWTYKYEEAARHGAAGAIIVHETGAAGYGWEVVSGSWSGPQFDLMASNDNVRNAARPDTVAVEGWITEQVAEQLFKAAGSDYGEMKRRALQRNFKATPLPLSMTVNLENDISRYDSRNVMGLLPGSDRTAEYIIYMAHWDHLGKAEDLPGDQIFNGAVDNASGTAALIALAEAFSAGAKPLARSILFMAVTAEESGLLGSEYYGKHPIYPLKDTVAAINMDGLNVVGPMADVVVIGYGRSELERYLAEAAARQSRYLAAEPSPEKGYFYRSDHFNLAKVGVPVLYAKSGVDSVSHGRDWGLAQMGDYVAERYHKPADEYDPNWDLSGARQDLELYFRIGQRLADEDSFPNWYSSSEFRAIRDRSRPN